MILQIVRVSQIRAGEEDVLRKKKLWFGIALDRLGETLTEDHHGKGSNKTESQN